MGVFLKHDSDKSCLLGIDKVGEMLREAGVIPNQNQLQIEVDAIRNDTRLISLSQFVRLCQNL